MAGIAILLFAGYLIWQIAEKIMCDRARASFKRVIHVSGIRGKTSVCRMIDAHLRAAGFRVFTKTTGTCPSCIDTEGREKKIRRFAPANIHEQMRVMFRARRENAEILIVECMAVSPEYQLISQQKMLRADMSVITNVRYDHTYEMGEDLQDIAKSLCSVIPQNGILFTSDERFYEFFSEKCLEAGSRCILCRPDDLAPDENEAIAAAVGEELGVPRKDLARHLSDMKSEAGSLQLYTDGEKTFLNLFSANDPESTLMQLKKFFPDSDNITLLYNNRTDRPDRLEMFARYFFPAVPCRKRIVMGGSSSFAARELKKAGFPDVIRVHSWKDVLAMSDTGTVVGIGNIKGQGLDMVGYFEGRKVR